MQHRIDLKQIFTEAHNRKYPKSQILLYQGEQSRDVYYIYSGHIKVYDVTIQGAEKLILILGPGDIFPVVWTFSGGEGLNYFYETLNDCEVSVISRDEFLEAIETKHEFTLAMLEYFVNRTQELMGRIDCIEATSAKHKVAQVLVYLADAHGDVVAEQTYKVRIGITHQIISDMAGINRATASLQLKELEDEKMYKNNANSLIIHKDRLEEFLDTPV